MNKEFIPYEQALELKELGFDEPCMKYYRSGHPEGYYLHKFDVYLPNSHRIFDKDNLMCTAPLYQQAFRWFREEHNLCGAVGWIKSEGGAYSIMNDELVWEVDVLYPTYEEAELACLKKLIEIVKNK